MVSRSAKHLLSFVHVFLCILGLLSLVSSNDKSISEPLFSGRRTMSVERKGEVVQGAGRSIYLIVDNVRHHIPDWSTFVSLGFGADNIKRIPQEKLDGYTEGPAVGAIEEAVNAPSPYEGCPCVHQSNYDINTKSGNSSKQITSVCILESALATGTSLPSSCALTARLHIPTRGSRFIWFRRKVLLEARVFLPSNLMSTGRAVLTAPSTATSPSRSSTLLLRGGGAPRKISAPSRAWVELWKRRCLSNGC